MKRYLFPSRLWQRLFIWLPTVLLCYALLVALICLVADAMQAPPEPGAMFLLPMGFFIIIIALVFLPVLVFLTELAAFLWRGRKPMNGTDYAISMALLPIVNGAFIYASASLMTRSPAWPLAHWIAAGAVALFTELCFLIPLAAKIRDAWKRLPILFLLSWMWGVTLVLGIGGILESYEPMPPSPEGYFPTSLCFLLLFSVGGLVPSILPFVVGEMFCTGASVGNRCKKTAAVPQTDTAAL